MLCAATEILWLLLRSSHNPSRGRKVNHRSARLFVAVGARFDCWPTDADQHPTPNATALSFALSSAYQAFSLGAAEANPFVSAAISNWSVTYVATASVYASVTVVCLWKILSW